MTTLTSKSLGKTTDSQAISTKSWKGAKPIPMLITCGIGVAIASLPLPEGLTRQTWNLFAIFCSIITGLITRPLPTAPVVLMGMLTCILTKSLSFNDIFIGYSKPSIWLIVTSFFLATGLIKTGLAERGAYVFVQLFGKKTLGLSYSIIFSEVILAPFIPSLVARSAGIILPILLALAKSNQSEPGDPKTGNTGAFLLVCGFHGSLIASAMFMTSMAANPIAVQIASDFGLTITWGKWALAAIAPGLVSLILIPLLVYKLVPPNVKSTPNAPVLARQKLYEMGKMKLEEWFMLGIFIFVLGLWLFGTPFGINNAVAALLGVMLLIITGVISWKDCLSHQTAWDTLFWLGALIAIGTGLKNLGFFNWFSFNAVGMISHMNWVTASVIMTLLYFYTHYFFASNTAHLTAMFSAFLAAGIQIGTPPMLLFLMLAFFSSLMGGLTHYGCGPAPIYFGAGYVSLKRWWRLGLIICTANIFIWITVGSLWTKLLKFW